MDPHLIPLLENPPTLRPPTLPRCTGSSRFASRHCCEKLSLKILADQLRLSPNTAATMLADAKGRSESEGKRSGSDPEGTKESFPEFHNEGRKVRERFLRWPGCEFRRSQF